MNKKIIPYLLLALLLFVGGGVFFWPKSTKKIRPLKQGPVPSLAMDSNLTQNLAFDPDQVNEIRWTVDSVVSSAESSAVRRAGEAQTSLLFKREKAGGTWTPPHNDSVLQDRLNLLARIHVLKMADAKSGAGLGVSSGQDSKEFHFQLSFFDGTRWSGVLRRDQAFWTSGPSAGFGVSLKPAQQFVLKQGILTKENQELHLCEEAVFEMGLKQKVFRVQFHDLRWTAEPPEEGIGNFIGNWLSQFCVIPLDAIGPNEASSSLGSSDHSDFAETLYFVYSHQKRKEIHLLRKNSQAAQEFETMMNGKKIRFRSQKMENGFHQMVQRTEKR